MRELPTEVECVLHRHVHALAGLSGVGVAGVAEDEDARHLLPGFLDWDIVEAVGHAVADLVNRPPGNVLHLDRVWVEDLVGVANDLFERGLADLAVVVRSGFAEVDVHARHRATFAWNVEDRAAIVGLDRTLGTPVWEVSFNDGVDDTPRVCGLLAYAGCADVAADLRTRTVGADEVLGAHRELFASLLAERVPQVHEQWVFLGVVAFVGNVFDAVVRLHAGWLVAHELAEVLHNARLVDDQVRELGDTVWVVRGECRADDVLWVFWVRLPERHFAEVEGLVDHAVCESEGLERFDGASLDAVCLADLQLVFAALDKAHIELWEDRKLRCGGHTGGAFTHDQYVHDLRKVFTTVDADACGFLDEGVSGHIAVVVKLHSGSIAVKRYRGQTITEKFDMRTLHSVFATVIYPTGFEPGRNSL